MAVTDLTASTYKGLPVDPTVPYNSSDPNSSRYSPGDISPTLSPDRMEASSTKKTIAVDNAKFAPNGGIGGD